MDWLTNNNGTWICVDSERERRGRIVLDGDYKAMCILLYAYEHNGNDVIQQKSFSVLYDAMQWVENTYKAFITKG